MITSPDPLCEMPFSPSFFCTTPIEGLTCREITPSQRRAIGSLSGAPSHGRAWWANTLMETSFLMHHNPIVHRTFENKYI
ncbi:hypothetical protein DAI22_07g075600 [Oryza sativa Japonica Group]|nr:hypothetical protein DAI22_07g075600 [Oryza sativa Japonica Group]